MNRSLFNHTLEIDVPDGFIENSECERYPYTDRPDIILTREETKTDITLSRFKKKLLKEETKAAIKAVLNTLDGMGNCKKISTYHFFKGRDLEGYWVFFVNTGVVGEGFNCMAVFPINREFTMITLSTEYESRKEGRRIFRQMLNSLKDQSREIIR